MNRTEKTFIFNGKEVKYYQLSALNDAHTDHISRLPYTIRILLESLLRQQDDEVITTAHIEGLLHYGKKEKTDVPFKPSRVILQDFTGVPAVVDLASMRKAMVDLGGDPGHINPEVPVDLVIDHSVQVDQFGSNEALAANMTFEFNRNTERYQFLNWAQKSFDNYRVVPPATGIVHQVNLEYLAQVIHLTKTSETSYLAYPDTLVGTDSHTTMINGLGVLGWGVGGIEAEAGMLGQPSYFKVPDVIGVKFVGKMPKGITATDLALKVTKVLRHHHVVGKFVEFFGPGLKDMPLADRATIANMAPEYGATCGFFPVDDEVINYLHLTGRDETQIKLVETYCKLNHLWYDETKSEPDYTEQLVIDLETLQPSLSGPKRPQDLIVLKDMKKSFNHAITSTDATQGFALDVSEFKKEVPVVHEDQRKSTLKTGSVVIAAITSCTNTSNPYVMLAAGMLAKRAVLKGLTVAPYVKTSLAPGSKVVTRYLKDAGLMSYLETLGFNTVGYGCTTCIGNSGPLEASVESAIMTHELTVASVLSGNRNFEGRIHPLVKANYLASPPLVVAYALAGTVDIDLTTEPLGYDQNQTPVFFNDLMPSVEEVSQAVFDVVTPEIFKTEYESIFTSNKQWNEIKTTDDPLYNWDESSTYIQNPPYFEQLSRDKSTVKSLKNLRLVGMFGDSVTTDHISPAGAIAKDMPAGTYLQSCGVKPRDFNSYGSRRGNHEVMMRGTFGNIRIKNKLASGTEGGYTTYFPTGEVMSIYDACKKYEVAGTGLAIIAGRDYGMGSSRDWAAKGTRLLGIKLVIAKSYERIHRSNLVMMGVLPLQFMDHEDQQTLKLTGNESFSVDLNDTISTNETVTVTATKADGHVITFKALARFDSDIEIEYYRHGGILPMVLRQKLAK